jgi:hypothetical protein
MFVSFYVKNNKVIIVDSDFTDAYHKMDLWVAIIEIYKKRNLNVAVNLVRAALYCNKQYAMPIDYYLHKDSKILSKYYNDIQKYLTLM